MKRRRCTAFVWPAVLAAALTATASPARGADKQHFSALRMIRFSKPVTTTEFKLKDLEGNLVSFSSFKGKVVLLNFWTTW